MFKKKYLKIAFLLVCLSGFSQEDTAWQNILDEELSHWDTYLSYELTDDYNGEQPKDDKGNLIAPIGLNNDSFGVFTTIKEDKDVVLKVSGQVYGCIFTKNEYENYHLKLQVKWGDKKYIPRLHQFKDSGLMYHSSGPHGADHFRSWMLSQEFQIMEGHMGDFWSQINSAMDIRAYRSEKIINASSP